MRTSRALLGSIVLVLALGYTNAGAPTFGGATRAGSLLKSATASDAGDLQFWFTPTTEVAAGGTIHLESDTDIAATAADTVCVVRCNDGATSVPLSGTGSHTTWTSTKVLLITTQTTPCVINKVAYITCPKAQLAANGASAADVKFKVKTSADTTFTTLATGYSIVAAQSVTWTSATVGAANVGLAPGAITFNFKPNKAIAATNVVTITANKEIFAADGATTCTATTILHSTTGLAGNADVTSGTVSGTKKILKVIMNANLITGLAATITCTTNMAVNPAAGAVTFDIETTTDTVALTAQTGYTTVTPVTSALAGVARGTSTVKSEASGDLVFAFTPRETVAATKFVTLTASEAIFAATATCTCTIKTSVTASSAGTVVAITSGDATSTTALKITSNGDMLKDVVNVITCTANLANNGATAQAVTFTLESNVGQDATPWGIPGYTLAAAKSVTWGSVTRATSVVSALAGGDLVVTFTPNTAVASAGIVTITPSSNIFTADAATTCTATSGGKAATVTSSATVGAVLKVTMGAALTPGYAAVITCTTNLANNGAAGAITFAIETSTDTVGLTAQTGYTITAASASNYTGSSSAATGTETTVTQVYTFADLTVAAYTGKMKSNCECAYANTVEGASTPTWCVATTSAYTYKSGVTMSSRAARRAAKVTFVLKVKSSVKSTAQLQTLVASGSTNTAFQAALTAVNGLSNYTAAPGTATVATATFTGGSSSASTLLPSMLSLVAAIFVAARQ